MLKSVLVSLKRTIKWLTRFFKSTDYSSEVLERQEKLTFKMKSAWKKYTTDYFQRKTVWQVCKVMYELHYNKQEQQWTHSAFDI